MNFLIILYVAVLLAKFIWWMISPSNSDIYVELSNINAYDNSGKFIINRNPFGIVVVPPPPPTPMIVSEITLTGLYLDYPSDRSMAFYELKSKPYIAKVGDNIPNSSAIVKSITAEGIVIRENNVDTNIHIGKGSGTPQVIVSPSNTNNQNNSLNNPQLNNYGRENLMHNPRSDIYQSFENVKREHSRDYQDSSLADERRKMIEEFIRRKNNEMGNGH